MSTDPSVDDKLDTVLAHAGRTPADNHGIVNPPVYHASTILFSSASEILKPTQKYVYGRRGTPTISALEEALCTLEGAAGVVLAPSGMSAVSLALQSCLSAGDHVLIADSVYRPTRFFADTVLARFGVEASYYDPTRSGELEPMMRENTRAVFAESPGSLTMELQDMDALIATAHDHDALVLMDNTWATPMFYRPLDHGVDLSIMAGTKYVSGHSDVMIGSVAANERAFGALHATHGAMGLCVGPDDIYLALRGLRTMGVRLRQHMQNAMSIARWLEQRPEISRVFYPGLESHPQHDLWKRDFSGASGLLTLELQSGSEPAAEVFMDSLRLFGLGASWGGFESLAIWANPQKFRTATTWEGQGQMVRLHIGLEDVGDLKADLEQALVKHAAALDDL